jgi:hypothetical protein
MKEFFQRTWVRHTLIVLNILLFWQVGAKLLRDKAYRNAIIILQPRNENSKLTQKGITTISTKNKFELQKLQNLSSILENRKEEKKQTFLDLYQYHFASATLLLILSSLSIVVIFIVAQVGLNNTNPYLRTIFFVLAALTSFYVLTPVVYKQDTNISKNPSGYLSYDNLQQDVYNYAVTGTTSNYDSVNIEKFHSSVINAMSKINTIDFEFDYKAIPAPDFGLKK